MGTQWLNHFVDELSPAKRALLELQLKKSQRETNTPQNITRRSSVDSAQLSFAQQRLWFNHQLEPQSAAYNEARAYRFMSGVLNVTALQNALGQIVARHEILRTVYVAVDGSPTQVVAEANPVELQLIDLSSLVPNATGRTTLCISDFRILLPYDRCVKH